MKHLLGIALLTMGVQASAEINDLRTIPVHQVLEVYEMQEEPSSDQGWIYQFETTSLGEEMQHLVDLKEMEVERIKN